MSIKKFISICMITLSIFMIVLSIFLLSDNLNDYRSTRDADILVRAVESLTKVMETMSPERGATGVALDGAPDTRAILGETRKRLDTAFDAVEKISQTFSLPEIKESSTRLIKIRDEIKQWRQQADSVTGKDSGEISEFRKKYFSRMFELSNETGKIYTLLERRLLALDAEVANQASLAKTTWSLRDHAGRESTLYLNMLLSGKPFTQEGLHDINVQDGRVRQLWETLSERADAPDSSPVLRSGMAKVQTDFFVPFNELRERVNKAGMKDGVYDLTPVEWRRLSGPMLQAIMQMRDAAITEASNVAAEKQSVSLRNLIFMGVLLVAALGTLVIVVTGIHRRVVLPLAQLTTVIGSFADGSRDFIVPHVERADEIGLMAKAIEVLRDNARVADERAQREAEEVQRREQRRQRIEDITTRFVDSIDTVVAGVTKAVDGLRQATATLSDTSSTTMEQSGTVSAAADNASTNVQTVAAAAEELSNSIQEISRRVSETATAMDAAVRQAEDTNTTVRGLAEAARRIGDVVNLITDIASQTNLLALNATIEAARAGDAGKGFAVVAGEVKSLANQTAHATDDIQTQITAIQTETERAVSVIAHIGTTIGTVNQSTIGIASAVEEQGAATQEIARNVQQAAAGTAEVSTAINRVLEAERNITSAVSQLSLLADRLSDESHHLRNEVSGFIAEVKAG